MPTLNTLDVRVFRNLTRRRHSIQAKVGGSWRTVAHADAVLIEPATFKVSEAGRSVTMARAVLLHPAGMVSGSAV